MTPKEQFQQFQRSQNQDRDSQSQETGSKQRSLQRQCWLCGKHGHVMSDCDRKQRVSPREHKMYSAKMTPGKPFTQFQLSHNPRRDSKNQGLSSEPRLLQRQCWICGKHGHIRSDCDRYRPRRPTPQCYTCDKFGHVQRNCPNANRTVAAERRSEHHQDD